MNRPDASVVAWGIGWALASVVLPVVAHFVDASPWSIVVAAVIVALPLCTAPVFMTARRAAAAHPALEAVAWTLAFVMAVAVFARMTMSFEPVNVVTTESIRQRQHAAHWPYPTELVWAVRCGVGFCTVAGASSALLNAAEHTSVSLLWRGMAFIACVVTALGAATMCFVLVAPVAMRPLSAAGVPLAGFLAGCLAGVCILNGRRWLLGPANADTRFH